MLLSSATLRFDRDYAETLILADNTEVSIRLVRPEDKQLLARAFAELSPESRYARFFSAKGSLSEGELVALTQTDGVNHLALGAVTWDAERRPVPLGVARFVRVAAEPEVADAAVAVVDAYQGRGLGTLLVERLAAAARERGVQWFRCEFLLANERVRRLIENLVPVTRYETDGDLVYADIPVPAPAAGGGISERFGESVLHGILSHSASGILSVELRRALLKVKE